MKCLFWVTPTRRLYDLFWAIHAMKEQKPAGRGGALRQARSDVPAAASGAMAAKRRETMPVVAQAAFAGGALRRLVDLLLAKPAVEA